MKAEKIIENIVPVIIIVLIIGGLYLLSLIPEKAFLAIDNISISSFIGPFLLFALVLLVLKVRTR